MKAEFENSKTMISFLLLKEAKKKNKK